jgi:hypothetical protein
MIAVTNYTTLRILTDILKVNEASLTAKNAWVFVRYHALVTINTLSSFDIRQDMYFSITGDSACICSMQRCGDVITPTSIAGKTLEHSMRKPEI